MTTHIAERYAQPANKTTGQILLKNHLESSFCRKFSTGKTALSIGINHATQTLQDQGFHVTGIDSSYGSLDNCCCITGNSEKMLLKPYRATQPSNDDNGYDTLAAFDALTHGAHWKSRLQEWAKAIRENGRLIFNAYSLDHLKWISKHSTTPNTSTYDYTSIGLPHLNVNDIIDAADTLGLSVVALQPYAAFLDRRDDIPLYNGTLRRFYWWQRLISWMAYDRKLFDLAVLVEEELVAGMSSAASDRYMIVLEKRSDTSANRLWREQSTYAADALTQNATHENTAYSHDLREKLSALLLDGPRNLRYLGALKSAFHHIGLPFNVEPLLSEAGKRALTEIEWQADMDERAMAMAEGWHTLPEINTLMTMDDIPLNGITDYKMITPMLIFAVKAFPEFLK